MSPIGTAEEGAKRGRRLLGDEAVGLAAVDAGVSAAHAYPGPPATEVVETVPGLARKNGWPVAPSCANEKTAHEHAVAAKGAPVVEANLTAFRFGREVAACTTAR